MQRLSQCLQQVACRLNSRLSACDFYQYLSAIPDPDPDRTRCILIHGESSMASEAMGMFTRVAGDIYFYDVIVNISDVFYIHVVIIGLILYSGRTSCVCCVFISQLS